MGRVPNFGPITSETSRNLSTKLVRDIDNTLCMKIINTVAFIILFLIWNTLKWVTNGNMGTWRKLTLIHAFKVKFGGVIH